MAKYTSLSINLMRHSDRQTLRWVLESEVMEELLTLLSTWGAPMLAAISVEQAGESKA